MSEVLRDWLGDPVSMKLSEEQINALISVAKGKEDMISRVTEGEKEDRFEELYSNLEGRKSDVLVRLDGSAWYDLQVDAYNTAKNNGFHEDDHGKYGVPLRLALIHTEVSEAVEAWRRGRGKVGLAEELADIVLRVADMAEAEGVNLARAIGAKMIINRGRSWRHGGKKQH